MTISFNRIEIHHFMSFDDEIFDFSKQNGMNLVTGKNLDIPEGKNGAGKSTIFNALLYGLFGQFTNKLTTSFIANRNIEDKEVRIVIYLDVDRVKYKIVSGLNKRVQGYFNIYQILDNGDEHDLTKSTISESRKFFEDEIIRCDMSLFLRIVMLTSEQNYNFFNLKKQDKKEFIEKLFDISVFGDIYDSIHKDILQADKKILSHQNQLLVLSNNQKNYSDKSQQFLNEQEEKLKKLNDSISAKQKYLNEISSKKVQKNNELIDKCNDAIEKIQKSVQECNQTLLQNKNIIQNLNYSIEQTKKQIQDKQSVINKHKALLGKLCDDCKKTFTEYYSLDKYNKEILQLNKKIEEDTKSIISYKEIYQQTQGKITALNDKDQKIRKKIKELTFEYDQMVQLKNNTTSELQMLQFKLNQLNESKNPYTELIKQNKELFDSEKNSLSEIAQTYKYLKKAEEIVSHESLKKFIIKDLISVINNRIRHYLSKMGSQYTCIFDENLDYEFITDSGKCDLYNFSCGEKKRLEIATCLSFRDFIAQRSNIHSNILILDEYIDSAIDPLAVESILNIFKDFTQIDKQNIFVISHRSEVNELMFNHIIEVRKHNGISKIYYLS